MDRSAEEVKGLQQTASDLIEAGTSSHIREDCSDIAAQHQNTVEHLNVSLWYLYIVSENLE